jgi:hypothetical protein
MCVPMPLSLREPVPRQIFSSCPPTPFPHLTERAPLLHTLPVPLMRASRSTVETPSSCAVIAVSSREVTIPQTPSKPSRRDLYSTAKLRRGQATPATVWARRHLLEHLHALELLSDHSISDPDRPSGLPPQASPLWPPSSSRARHVEPFPCPTAKMDCPPFQLTLAPSPDPPPPPACQMDDHHRRPATPSVPPLFFNLEAAQPVLGLARFGPW